MDTAHRFRYRLEYFLARGLFSGLSLLPGGAGASAGRALGRGIGLLLGSRRRLAAANLKAAFPSASDGQIRRWVRECWENLGQSAWEFARIPHMTEENLSRRVDVEGIEHLVESHRRGKGVLLFTAHYGNWEMVSRVVATAGAPLAMIARRMKNPYVNDFVTRVRAHWGGKVFMHKQAVRESMRWLRQGGVLGLLIDQRITDGGATVPFFGRPAYTTTLPAILALRLGAPVHPVRSWREGDRLRVRFDPAMDLSGYQAREEDILKATADMTAVVESWARERPPMWLWIHDRWKL